MVDGQQLVTSLANALHPDGARDPRFNLGYDMRDDRIVNRLGIDDPYVIPLPTLFDLAKVLDWFATHPEVSDYRSKAFELAKHLRQFAIPAYPDDNKRRGDLEFRDEDRDSAFVAGEEALSRSIRDLLSVLDDH